MLQKTKGCFIFLGSLTELAQQVFPGFPFILLQKHHFPGGGFGDGSGKAVSIAWSRQGGMGSCPREQAFAHTPPCCFLILPAPWTPPDPYPGGQPWPSSHPIPFPGLCSRQSMAGAACQWHSVIHRARVEKTAGKEEPGRLFPKLGELSEAARPRSQVAFEREQLPASLGTGGTGSAHSQEGPFLTEFWDGTHPRASNQVFVNLQEGGFRALVEQRAQKEGDW